MRFIHLLLCSYLFCSFSIKAETLSLNLIEGAKEIYQLDLLKLALSYSGEEHDFTQASTFYNEAQLTSRIDSGEVDVMWAGTKTAYENRFLPIRVPLFKGLLGHRIFIIRQGKQSEFNTIKNKTDLLKFSAGQGRDWADTAILRNAGVKVLTTTKYANLFPMLEGGRFDYFPRGVHEPWSEVIDNKHLPLEIEKRVLVVYPLAMYFFVKKGNTELANKIASGLRKAIDDGSFDKFFFSNEVVRDALSQANLGQRLVFRIDNPHMPPETPFNDKSLWFDLDKVDEMMNKSF